MKVSPGDGNRKVGVRCVWVHVWCKVLEISTGISGQRSGLDGGLVFRTRRSTVGRRDEVLQMTGYS